MKKWWVIGGVVLFMSLAGIFLPQRFLKSVGNSRRYNVVLVTVDTLRADHTPFGGYTRPTLPATSEFFGDSVTFAQAETVRTQTNPAYATILTGLYPYHHGVRTIFEQLNNQNQTLPELLRSSGYVTAAFVSSFVMIGRFNGLNQGFDVYDDRLQERVATNETYESRAEDTVNRAIGWLRRRPHQPFFLFLHFIDPHGPYSPPPGFVIPFHSNLLQMLLPGEIPRYQLFPDQLNLYDYVDRYDGEIRYLDGQLARLYKELNGLKSDTWFLFTADHGESLGEHGQYFNHGRDCYEAESHVPMVWMPPAGLKAKYPPGTVRKVVSLVDIVPTVLDALGIHAGTALDGESLLPLMSGRPAADSVRFVERVEGDQFTFAARDSTFKLILDSRQDAPALYNLKSDPNETSNLSGSVSIPPALKQALDDYIEKAKSYHLPFKVQAFPAQLRHPGPARTRYVEGAGHESSPDDSDQEKLKALGYVD